MSSIKHFVAKSFERNPERYGTDTGDLHIVNDCLIEFGHDALTREQFKLITSTIRTRNIFLANNLNYDLRKRKAPPLFVQLSIYDFLDNDTATQTRKIVHYFSGGEERLNQSNSRIGKSVRGVDDEHITAVKVLYPLFYSNPQLKKQRINGDTKQIAYTGIDDDFVKKVETKLNDEVMDR